MGCHGPASHATSVVLGDHWLLAPKYEYMYITILFLVGLCMNLFMNVDVIGDG